METSAWQQLFDTPPYAVAFIFLGVLFLIRELSNLKRDVLNTLGLEKREEIEKKEAKERLDSLSRQIAELKESVDNQLGELRDKSLADKINDRYKRYFQLGYIPSDEFDEFIQIHEVYNKIGGNHTGDAKFKKCIESLKVKDVQQEG